MFLVLKAAPVDACYQVVGHVRWMIFNERIIESVVPNKLKNSATYPFTLYVMKGAHSPTEHEFNIWFVQEIGSGGSKESLAEAIELLSVYQSND